MKLYFYCTKMAANGGKEYSTAICCMMFIRLCLLCSMLCATALKTDSHNQSSNNFTSSPLQSFSSGTINAGRGTTAVREPSSCNITLENGPKNKTRNEGQRVSLICDLINENNGHVLWVYLSGPGKHRYISENDYIFPSEGQDNNNYKVVIDESLQTYKLIIKAATFPTDSGTYECGYRCNLNYIPLSSAVVTILPKFNPSLSCQMNLLPSLQSEADGDTFEIICFWAHGYEGNAHFQNASGGYVKTHLTFPGRVISRISASKAPNITCHFMSSSSSETMHASCTGNKSTRMLRVDPFISEATMNSNATFECSFSNHSYSYSGYWKIHYGANASLDRQENLIENQKVISIVNVSESHQSILVECALNVSENEKISSFGTIRIARMTTTPPDENLTRWTTNNISKTTTDISENRPTTTSMLSKATSIRVPSPQVSVPTTTVSKSVRPTTSTRMLSEASSVRVTSPLTLVATTTADISTTTRPTTATHMIPEAATITVTNTQKSVDTSPNIATPQRSGLPSCKFYKLPVADSDLYLNRAYELVCSWNHGQAYQAQLQRSNGQAIDNYLTFPDHIITRVNSSDAKGIYCGLSLNNNTSMAEIDAPCRETDTPSLIRVDPFVYEVDEGSTAVFTCTFNDRGRPSGLSWKVHSNGNVSAVDLEKSTKYPIVNFTIHEQKGGEYLIVECQLHGNRKMSSYGLVRIIKGTTFSLSTTSGASLTSQMTSSRAAQTLESTTEQNNITGTQPSIKKTTAKVTPSISDGKTALTTDKKSLQTEQFTTNLNNNDGTKPTFKTTPLKPQTSSTRRQTNQIMDNNTTVQPNAPFNRSLVVMISISVLVAVVILLLSIAIVYLLRKRKTTSLPRRLSEDGKADTIELSNIPHILHEESSEWYALSFKDKRVQDMQEQQSNDLIVKHHDESDQNIPILSSSLGIPSLHLLESIDENVYAEPDVSEEPIRQTISRQQCTFTPLLEDEQ